MPLATAGRHAVRVPLPNPAPAPARRRPHARSWLAGLCLTLAALLSLPAVVGYWAVNTLGNTANFVAVTAPLAADQQVQNVVSAQVSKQVVGSLGLGDVLGDALTKAVDSVVLGVLDTAAFAQVWSGAMAGAQRALMAGLSGNGITAEGDNVTLDLSPVLAGVRQGLLDRGLSPAETSDVPKLQITLDMIDADAMRSAQAVYRVVWPVAPVLPWLAGLLLIAAVALARRRGRMVVGAGLVVAGSALLVSVLVGVGGAAFARSVGNKPLAPISGIIYDQLMSGLTRWWPGQLIAGVAIVVLGLAWWLWSAHRDAAPTGLRSAG